MARAELTSTRRWKTPAAIHARPISFMGGIKTEIPLSSRTSA
jgi:hypothetical protein